MRKIGIMKYEESEVVCSTYIQLQETPRLSLRTASRDTKAVLTASRDTKAVLTASRDTKAVLTYSFKRHQGCPYIQLQETPILSLHTASRDTNAAVLTYSFKRHQCRCPYIQLQETPMPLSLHTASRDTNAVLTEIQLQETPMLSLDTAKLNHVSSCH